MTPKVRKQGNDRIKVVLVDDRESDREITRLGLRKHPDLEVIGEAEDGRQAIEVVRSQAPDVAVVDADMPVIDGPATIQRLRVEFPTLVTIGFSVLDDRETRAAMLDSGADAYLSKKQGVKKLARIIRELVA